MRAVAGTVAVGDHLVVGDDHEELVTLALQPDAVGQRAEVVAEVQGAGRPVAGEDAGHDVPFEVDMASVRTHSAGTARQGRPIRTALVEVRGSAGVAAVRGRPPGACAAALR